MNLCEEVSASWEDKKHGSFNPYCPYFSKFRVEESCWYRVHHSGTEYGPAVGLMSESSKINLHCEKQDSGPKTGVLQNGQRLCQEKLSWEELLDDIGTSAGHL